MASVINTNIQSLTAQRNLSVSQNSLSTSMQRLSSGLRINSAKDDAAGLAISERMSTQVRGLNQAARNANDGVSMAQTAEGALGTIGNNLQRIRELAVQSRNATNSKTDRNALNSEVQQLKQEIQRVAGQTDFNGTKLLDGSFENQAFQVGANQGQTINISQIANANTNQLGNWTSAVTAASVKGVVPTGATAAAAVPGTPAIPTTATQTGAFVAAAAGAAGQTFTLVVDGANAFTKTSDGSSGAGDAVTAAEVDAGVAAFVAASNGAYTQAGTVGAGNLVLSKTNGSDMVIALNTTFATTPGSLPGVTGTKTDGTLAVPGTPASSSWTAIGPGEFTLAGTNADGTAGTAVNITLDAAASANAGQRATALVNAINAKTSETNVTASVINGALSLQSTTGDFTIGSSLAAADFANATGLTAGVSGDATVGGTAYAAGTAKTGFADLDISTTTGADNAILAMDAALETVNSARADLGAIQNRFEAVVSNLAVNSENLSASRSRIMDADFAAETANLSRSQILQQAGTAMVAQANQLPQNVLKLLQ